MSYYIEDAGGLKIRIPMTSKKDLVDRIDEKTKKPSFEEFFFNKRNKHSIERKYDKHWDDAASAIGEEWLDDDRYDCEDMEASECYDNYSHAAGDQASYEASEYTIEDFKRKYDYKRGDERDEDKQYRLAEYLDRLSGW